MVPYETELVQVVDAIIKLAKGRGKRVTGEKDWDVIEKVIRMWQTLYPQESKFFYDSMKKWRVNSKPSGINREKGGAMIQHKLEVPQKLYQLIEAVYPDQKWDKRFVEKFAKRFELFAGNKI